MFSRPVALVGAFGPKSYGGELKNLVSNLAFGAEPVACHDQSPPCALRKLAREMGDNGLLESDTAAAMERIKGVTHQGVRAGKWLRKGQATDLLNAPDPSTLKGKRDRARCLRRWPNPPPQDRPTEAWWTNRREKLSREPCPLSARPTQNRAASSIMKSGCM